MHGAAGGISGDRGVGVELAPRALHALTYNASYLANMVKSWANSATRRFAEEGKSKFAGLDGEKAEDLLAALNAAAALSDLSLLKSVGLHKLTGDRKGQWAMTALAHLLSLRGRSCMERRDRRLSREDMGP